MNTRARVGDLPKKTEVGVTPTRPFPDAPRVIYQLNPLDEVVCRVAFPPILRIDAESPVAFQEDIRNDFPHYQLKTAVSLASSLPASVSHAVGGELSLLGGKSHLFSSPDKTWNLTLSRDGLSLSCRRYERWEQFRHCLERPFQAFMQKYGASFFTHVCLRYRDVIRRSRLELQNAEWSDLIQPWIAGTLGQSGIAD
jgi:uncharacterized protein (TIGR04255 family)